VGKKYGWQPFTAATGVRIPQGTPSPRALIVRGFMLIKRLPSGDFSLYESGD
jgi:hypothetical protein